MTRRNDMKEFLEFVRNIEESEPSANDDEARQKKAILIEMTQELRKFEADFLAVVHKVSKDGERIKKLNNTAVAHSSGERNVRKERSGRTSSRRKEARDAAPRSKKPKFEYSVQTIRDRVDAIRTPRDIERIARLSWPERAFQVTDIVNKITTTRKILRVLIIEDGSDADLDFFDTVGFDEPYLHLADDLQPGHAMSVSENFPAMEERDSETVALDELLTYTLVGKMRAGRNKRRSLTEIVERMNGILARAFPDSAKRPESQLVEIAVYLPSSVGEDLGRRIVESSWRGFGMKAHICRRPKIRREDPPSSKLSVLAVKAEAKTGLKYLSVVADLKSRIQPSACGIEVHKISHAANGDVRLRIKENEAGGKRKFAIEVRKNLQLHCCFK